MPRKTPRIAAKKKIIIEKLTAGDAPAQAARAAGISRNEAYTWRREDENFAKQWDNAVEEGIDQLETIAYKRAVDGSDGLLTMYLKCRRPEKWNRAPPSEATTNVNVRVSTLTEALAKMEKLGLPAPEIEGDYEVITGAAPVTIK